MLPFQEKHEKSLLGIALIAMLVLIYNKYLVLSPMPLDISSPKDQDRVLCAPHITHLLSYTTPPDTKVTY